MQELPDCLRGLAENSCSGDLSNNELIAKRERRATNLQQLTLRPALREIFHAGSWLLNLSAGTSFGHGAIRTTISFVG